MSSENDMVKTLTLNKCLCGRPVQVLEPPLSDARTQNHCKHIIPKPRAKFARVRSVAELYEWVRGD